MTWKRAAPLPRGLGGDAPAVAVIATVENTGACNGVSSNADAYAQAERYLRHAVAEMEDVTDELHTARPYGSARAEAMMGRDAALAEPDGEYASARDHGVTASAEKGGDAGLSARHL